MTLELLPFLRLYTKAAKHFYALPLLFYSRFIELPVLIKNRRTLLQERCKKAAMPAVRAHLILTFEKVF